PDYTGFDAAHVIDDDVFFDSGSMTLEEVSDFIARVNKGCVAGAVGGVAR
ncbi:hemagglutinin, partial [Actinomyces sp. 186855]|nr:hemagglutinin [Actinomyces sp. 186855]